MGNFGQWRIELCGNGTVVELKAWPLRWENWKDQYPMSCLTPDEARLLAVELLQCANVCEDLPDVDYRAIERVAKGEEH